ncbi:MAG: hypothetical protein EVJ47_03850 [Candidatus Acidulodesulfobacterium ferriphilum]|uniref:Uncharacterized protein n=1 Tax=Candidatus Acidulodesulfobacterium ferriphilum TaxID=2597223 RepID=A0A519BDR4_9DELT|nr:MAG: hypothetical protein EVJ47_03850 [Candidatus Acidulodesulfobacterium ferriphilum]
MTDEKDYRLGESPLYFNYRIRLKAKAEGYIKNIQDNCDIAGSDFKNSAFYHKFAEKVSGEIAALNKHCIKPIQTTRLIKNCGKNSFTPALPQFLHIYDPLNIFNINIKPPKGLFLTSSRFKDAKIYKPGKSILKDFKDYYAGKGNAEEGFICIGTNSEAEIEFIEKFDDPSPLIILPHYSLLTSSIPNKQAKLSKVSPTSRFDFKNILQISALDPFSKTSKYGFALRNNLAFHLSEEMAILYLSENSSLLSVMKKFKDAGKQVKIFEGERHAKGIHNNLTLPGSDAAKNKTEYSPIQEFILKTLEKENITIDNLIKLSNIKFNINSNEILKNVSMLEMNSEIERFPGGVIKKSN